MSLSEYQGGAIIALLEQIVESLDNVAQELNGMGQALAHANHLREEMAEDVSAS